MFKLAKLHWIHVLWILLFFISVGTGDMVSSRSPVITVMNPVLLVLFSFYIGYTRIRLRVVEVLIPFVLNIMFLYLTYKNKVFILNTYMISLLLWMIITPYMIRLRRGFSISVGICSE